MGIHKQAERDARRLLQRLNLDSIPVDPISIARKLDMEVWLSDLDAGVDGVLVKRSDERPEIYLSARNGLTRQKFTTAHEIGHFVERAGESTGKSAWNYVDYRNDLSAAGTDPHEMYANGFAAALLMPADHMTRLFKKCDGDTDDMAAEFGVSKIAMTLRIKNLGLRRAR